MTHTNSPMESSVYNTLNKTPSPSTFINSDNDKNKSNGNVSNNNNNFGSKNKRKLTIKPSITIRPTSIQNEKTVKEEEITTDEEEGLSGKLRRLQAIQKEQRQQQGVNDPYDDLTTNSTTFTSQRLFSFGYITLQVVLSPFRSLYFYLQALFTHSQQRYHQVNRHQKRTRHARLIEPTTKFLRIAFLVDDRPVVQWGWQMIAMFLWPILRVFGGGLLIDK